MSKIFSKIDIAICSMYDRRIGNWPYIYDNCIKYIGIKPEMFLAGDGHLTDYEYSFIDEQKTPPILPYSTKYPTWWSSKAYNVYKSHIGLLQKALGCQAKTLLMLEDDIIFEDDFNDIWNKAEDFFLTNEWDAIYFGGYNNRQTPVKKITNNIYQTLQTGGTHGWILKTHLIPKILEYGSITHVDDIMATYIQKQTKCYIIHPTIINQTSGYSYLEQTNLQKPSRYDLYFN